MTVSFELPDLGEEIAEGEVLAWHVEVGEHVDEDDVLAEVETDKAAVEVPSPVAGRIVERHAAVGDVVETGSTLVTIDDEAADDGDEEGTAAATADTDAAGSGADQDGGRRTFAPPSVRRLARERGVDLAAVEGSGPGGRITEEDVRNAAEEAADDEASEPVVKSAVRRVDQNGANEEGEADDGVQSAVAPVTDEPPADVAEGERADRERTLATPATRKLARELGVDLDEIPTDITRDGEPFVDEAAVRAHAATRGATEAEETATSSGPEDTGAGQATGPTPEGTGPTEATTSVPQAPGDRREPYQGIRRRIGEQMGQGWREVPHATHHDRVEVSDLVEARERLAPLAAERDVQLTDTPIVVKCVAEALTEHPIVNTHFDAAAEQIVFKEAIDVGVATATDRGLFVPVLEDADERGLIELATELADHVAAARDGAIEPAPMQGATFTVTDVDAIAGEYANPIVKVPQTAVLATGALRERPVAIEGEVVARPTLPLSLAIDHRVIDRADAARFVETLETYLQDPTRLLLG